MGSSAEGLAIAHHFQVALEAELPCEVTVWDQGSFGASNYTMVSLVQAAQASDFAVLVTTPDDTTTSRGVSSTSPRDNVLFELGLFMGALGVDRVFILAPAEPAVRLPSDLNGITRLPGYQQRSDGNLRAALTPAVLAAARAIRLRGGLSPQVSSPVQAPRAVDLEDADVALATEIGLICSSAEAQGWRVRTRSETTVRLVSPKGKAFTFSIAPSPVVARAELRRFAHELRAGGLRVNRRVRDAADGAT